MKLLTLLGNLILWILVALIAALATWGALQPYRVTTLLQNLASLSGPSKSQVAPFEGLILRIPKQIAGCGETEWVKTLVQAKAISVDGLCNINVTPEFARHIVVVGSAALPADCNESQTSPSGLWRAEKESTHLCVYSARMVSVELFPQSGFIGFTTVGAFFEFGDFTPFARIDRRLVLEKNPDSQRNEKPLSTLFQNGVAYGYDNGIKLQHTGGFNWKIVERQFRFVREVR